MVDDAFTAGQRTEDGGQTPDSELLRSYAAERSEAAFAELVRRYLDLVYSAALRQVGGDAHRAHDVAQVVFGTLARKAGSLIGHPALVGWLYTTTQLAAAKVRRSEARRHARELEAHAMMNESPPSPAPEIDWDRMRPVLDGAMRELNDRDRAAVLLRYFAHRPFAEIGATLNVSEDGARMRVDRAVDKLRGLLAQRGLTSTAAALALALTNSAVAAAPAGLAAQVTGSALAGGAAATGNLLVFMSTTKITAAAAAAVVLALGGAFYEMQTARDAQAALAAARRDDTARSTRLHALEARAREREQEVAQLRQSLQEARAGQAAEARAPQPAALPGGEKAALLSVVEKKSAELVAGDAFLAAHPDVKQALVDRSRARVAARFYPLYAKLKLTSAQIDRFEALLIEQEGLSLGDAQLGAMMLRPGVGLSNREVDEGLRALLGDEGFKEFQEAGRMANAHQFTTALAGALYFTNTPLTATQAEQMARLLVELPRRSDRPGITADWDVLVQRARGFLSEPQVAVIGRLRAQEEFGVTMKHLVVGGRQIAMKTKPLILGLALLVIVAAIGSGWRMAQDARAADAERTALLATRAAQEATARRLEERLAAADKDRTDVQATIVELRAAKKPPTVAPAPAATASGKEPKPGFVNPMELIAKDPKLQLLYLASVRAEFATSYGPFIVTQALTPGQVDKLADAAVRWKEQEQDLMGVALEKKLAPNDPDIAEMRKRAVDEQRATQTAILGEAGFEQLQRYERTLPVRALAERFAGAAAIGDVPITAHQAEQLTQAMAGALGNAPQRGGRVDASQVDWTALDTKAREILSPAQFSLFQRIEPIGGGPSRWMARLDRALNEAKRSLPPAAGAGKPGG